MSHSANRHSAMAFLNCFCGGDVDGLADLLAEDLQFKGPLYEFNARDAYLECLRNDPPGKFSHRVLNVTESEDCVSIYYDYQKPNGAITIAQLFQFKNQIISEILLVFDATGAGVTPIGKKATTTTSKRS